MKKTGVVAKIRTLENLAQAWVDFRAGGQCLKLAVRLDAAVLSDAQEDDAVEDALDREVELALREGGVAKR